MREPPFGTYALPAMLEGLRQTAIGMGRGAVARRLTSLIRRLCLLGRPDPVDVEPFAGQSARLYPRDNLSEKRVFGAAQFWDFAEREALAGALQTTDGPFTFVDAGANVGLYTLAMRSAGGIRGLAIEPDPENLRRLRFNLAASGADEVTVAACALAEQPGTIRLTASAGNRGEISVGTAESGGEVTEVAARPLLDVITEAGFNRVDALKIDIEGMEEPVLAAFFAQAPANLHPGMIIIEARRGEETPALALLKRNGYIATRRTKMNVILTPRDEEKDTQDGQA